MRLLLVELNRFRSRRAIALMLLGVVLLIGWMTIDTIWQTRPVSSTEVAAAKEQAAQDEESARQDYELCVDDPEGYFGDPSMGADDCALGIPDYHWYLSRQPLSLDEELNDTGKGAIVLLAGIAIIAGATFAGADWATGSMSNQLLFRPRRLQVWVTKAVAVSAGILVVAAVVLAAQWGTYAAAVDLRDLAFPTNFTHDLIGTLGRGLALVAGGALGGYALTMLLRSTVGTLALLFFYAVGGEALIGSLPLHHADQWRLSHNVFAWIDDGAEVYGWVPCGGGQCQESYVVSLAHGATYLALTLLVAVAVSLVLFRRRDIP